MALKRKHRKGPPQDGTQSQQTAVGKPTPSSISPDEAEMYRTIIQTANEGIWLIDGEARTLFTNDRLAALLGYGARELQGRAMMEFVFPEDVPSAQERIASSLQGAFEQCDLRLRRRDGSELPMLANISPVRDRAGRITGALGMFTDLTERKRLERRTREALEALLQMAHSLAQPLEALRPPDAACASAALRRLAELAKEVLGCERLNLVFLDPETETLEPVAMLGISPEQEQGWRARMRGLPLGAYLTQETIERLKVGEPVLVGPEQRRLPVQTPSLEVTRFVVVPLRSRERLLGGMSLDYGSGERTYTPDELALAQAMGNLVALVLEREHLAQSSREAQQQVETLEQEKAERETFISLVVHELRTPLTIISAHAQMLERNANMEETRRAETVRKIREQTWRLRRLIDDLQDVSRIAAGTFELAPEPTDLGALAKSVVEEQQATTTRHALRLTLPAAPIVGLWDRQRLSQVLSNLLSNAMKYSEGGEIRVTIQQDQAGVQVTVQDQGAGMTAEEIGQLFRLYSRLARTRQAAGNGLGLYLTRGILAAHGGRIWASSPGPGQGSTFTFTLPLSSSSSLAG